MLTDSAIVSLLLISAICYSIPNQSSDRGSGRNRREVKS
ncbi:hypothetical protein NSP_21760 [Nodularia spumigena CCY9414]|nr:hypothetical protein NSP_21760 [Nodularia spumigena CCY9414]